MAALQSVVPVHLQVGLVGALVVGVLTALYYFFKNSQQSNKGVLDQTEEAGLSLWTAAEEGRMYDLALLCQEWKGNVAVLNWTNSEWENSTPLLAACAWDKLEAVKILLQTPGVDLNKAGKTGWTALFLAAVNGYVEIVKVLLAEEGIVLNKAPTGGVYECCTPLMIAMANPFRREQCSLVVDLLKARGADKG